MDDITVSIVNWAERQAEIASVRRAVFIEEQNVPEDLELDGKDPDCRHVLAWDKSGAPVGTARLGAAGRIGRMAVLRECRCRRKHKNARELHKHFKRSRTRTTIPGYPGK